MKRIPIQIRMKIEDEKIDEIVIIRNCFKGKMYS